MADLPWPQNAPTSTTPVTSGDLVGMYKPAEPGASKNVQVDVDEIASYAAEGLQTQITQNASDISDNTSAITANTGLIDDNAVRISANESNLDALNGIDGPQNLGPSDSPTFADATIAGSTMSTINSYASTANSRMDQSVKTTDSPTFVAVTSGSSALKWKVFSGTTGTTTTLITHGISGTILGASGTILSSGTYFLIGVDDGGASFSFTQRVESTQIRLVNSGSSSYNGLPYRIVLFYV